MSIKICMHNLKQCTRIFKIVTVSTCWVIRTNRPNTENTTADNVIIDHHRSSVFLDLTFQFLGWSVLSTEPSSGQYSSNLALDKSRQQRRSHYYLLFKPLIIYESIIFVTPLDLKLCNPYSTCIEEFCFSLLFPSIGLILITNV